MGHQYPGTIAQLGEHLPYKQGVTGSSPVGPITFLNKQLFGEIAQLARARGSYPRCRGFESPSRYFLLLIAIRIEELTSIVIYDYGEIAQLARARGSYPRCRGFESPSRYFFYANMECKNGRITFTFLFLSKIISFFILLIHLSKNVVY